MAIEAIVDGNPAIIADVAVVSAPSAGSSNAVYIKGDKGDPGEAATIAVGETTTLPAGSDATVTNSGTSSDAIFDFGIPAGADGADGQDGEDGFSPTVSSETIAGGHRITIIDADGSTAVDVMDGIDGQDGSDGQDGFSPTVTPSAIAGGHRLTIVDVDGTSTVDVMDGVDGQDGADGTDGVDGFSPTIVSASIAGGHQLTITDVDGTTTVDVMDGVDGQDGQDGSDGQDGFSPVITSEAITGGHRLTITDAQGTSTVDVMDGLDGQDGVGVPTGGTTGQVLAKASGADYDTEWKTPDPGVDPATVDPLMDGTAAVGSSAKYAREDHRHPVYDQLVRPNLLDNWYFVGGGSQLGYGTFPINQRGQTSYTNTGYTIDRWDCGTNLSALNVKSDCVQYVSGTAVGYKRITNKLANGIIVEGNTYTLSVLMKVNSVNGNVQLRLCYNNYYAAISGAVAYITETGLQLATLTVTVPSGYAVKNAVEILVSNTASDYIDVDMYAWKLELGNTQTLAHQENGVWVLNEIPDYNEQLARCERFFIKFGAYVRIRASLIGTNSIQFFLPTPVSMATNKDAIVGGSPLIESLSGTVQTGFTISPLVQTYDGVSANGVVLSAAKTSHGMSDALLRTNSMTISVEP